MRRWHSGQAASQKPQLKREWSPWSKIRLDFRKTVRFFKDFATTLLNSNLTCPATQSVSRKYAARREIYEPKAGQKMMPGRDRISNNHDPALTRQQRRKHSPQDRVSHIESARAGRNTRASVSWKKKPEGLVGIFCARTGRAPLIVGY
jgi:hypothetical protein